jgi:hypothetical protein bfra3_05368
MKRIPHYQSASAFVRRAALAGLLVLAAACTNDRMEEGLTPEPGQPEQVEVKIRLRTNQPASPTRALSVEQESLINDVYVFFFNTTDNRVYTVVKGKNVTPTVSDPTKWTFTASLIVNTGTRTTFDCLVLTNVDGWMQGKNLTDFNGKNYDDLQTMLVSNELSPAALPAASPAEGLVMWGKAASPISVPADAASITVPAIRALASVEVGVGKGPAAENLATWPGWNGKDASGKDIPFVLKKVYVYRPNNRYAFMPLATVYDASRRKVTAPSPEGISALITAPFIYDLPARAYGIRREIYLPEADIRQTVPGGPGHTGKPGDAGHKDRCALVVCGSYNGHADSYYRIDFNDNAADRSLIDLLRNHRYCVSITSVQGDGETSAQEAYESLRINMGIEITGWTDNFQDIVFDGTDWMYAQKKNIILPGNEGQKGTIDMESSIDPADWEMSFDGGVSYTRNASLENTDFRVTKPATATDGKLEIKTLRAMAGNDPDRTSTLTIKAKRLKFDIRITQKPDNQADWEQEGGEFDKDF